MPPGPGGRAARRAGEAGMGFAVVAEEVRNLAQRCSQAAKDTSVLIAESITHARTGKVRLDEVAEAMQQVTVNSSEIGRLSEQVSSGSDEQARGIEQISRAILQIQEVTQKTAASAEEGAAAGRPVCAPGIRTPEWHGPAVTTHVVGDVVGSDRFGPSPNRSTPAVDSSSGRSNF